jgi:ketosteroid isomerase-like protein
MAANDHPNAARAREYLEAFASGDPEAVAAFFDDDIVWRVGGNHPLSGAYRGKAAVAGYLDEAQAQTGGTLTLEPEAVLASDDHLALFLQVRGERNGQPLDVGMTQIVKVGPDGRWQEYWALSGEQDAVDEFWSAS